MKQPTWAARIMLPCACRLSWTISHVYPQMPLFIYLIMVLSHSLLSPRGQTRCGDSEEQRRFPHWGKWSDNIWSDSWPHPSTKGNMAFQVSNENWVKSAEWRNARAALPVRKAYVETWVMEGNSRWCIGSDRCLGGWDGVMQLDEKDRRRMKEVW